MRNEKSLLFDTAADLDLMDPHSESNLRHLGRGPRPGFSSKMRSEHERKARFVEAVQRLQVWQQLSHFHEQQHNHELLLLPRKRRPAQTGQSAETGEVNHS